MAWSSSYDGNRILSINQMNSAISGYNIFSYSSDKCPTKAELLATSATAGGYTYRVTISGSYADNQLVPNSALGVSATADTYTVHLTIYFRMDDYSTGTSDQIHNKWTYSSGGVYYTQIPGYLDVWGANGESRQFTFNLYGQIDATLPDYRNLYDLNGSYSTSFVMPKNVIIEGFTVSSECDLKFDSGIDYSISSSAQGKNHTVSMDVYVVR